ncbi:hypothetical protein BDQ17DRAFT_1365619 [Cyathus striatus]|nr:hypothetical protein BDQ17DRAFT_1365619 [Cyathus striatus]
MDYLRNLGSAAVSTFVQKSGLNLPFTLGPKVDTPSPIYNLYDATKKDDSSPVSVFEYDFTEPARRNFKPLAQNALRKLRTTRHPDILKFIDAVESESTIYIMTERVRPLHSTLSTYSSRPAQEREDWLLWGIHRISIALTFVNDPCASTHGNLSTHSIFLSPSGEWKLGGFELITSTKDSSGVLYSMANVLPTSTSIASPEVKKSGWHTLKDYDPSVADAYALGLLLHVIFNPSHPPLPTAEPPHPPPQPSARGAIPTTIFPAFKKLLNPNPKGRLVVKGFLDLGMAENGFFSSNRLIRICIGLDDFTLAGEAEKTSFLRMLKETASTFPPEFASYRVLPSLLAALEFGGASAASILPLVFQLGKNVSPEEYSSRILAPLIKLYANPDRGTRMALLDHLPEYAEKLDKKTVSDKIFPHLQTGFSDTVAVIREATVKSIILLSPKLTDRLLNNDLLRLLAKMQMDPEPSIRTNTCILIGRLGPSLGYNTKRKVLVPAFSRALKDTFVHCRVAGLMALMATTDCFEIEEIATKVIPNMAFTTLDKEKLVRDQAFKALDLFIKKLEAHAATMSEAAVVEPSDIHITSTGQGTLVNSAAGAAGALAGWAITSLGKKLATTDLQSTLTAAGPSIDRPTSAPVPPGGFSLESHIGELRKAPVSSSSLSQLGANKLPANTALVEFLSEEARANGINNNEVNPWGNDDLIDVNADEGDWSAFETAPVVVEPKPALHSVAGTVSILNDQKLLRQSAENDAWESVQVLDPWQNTAKAHATPAHKRVKSPTSFKQRETSPSLNHESPLHSPAPRDKSILVTATEPKAVSPALPLTPSMATMSKEGKAAEMARRKEERKQRIAALKEQKKSALGT